MADPISEKQFEKIQELVVTARNAKAEMGLQKQKPSLQVACEDLRWLEIFRTHQDTILRLAGLQAMHSDARPFGGGSPDVRSGRSLILRILHEEKVDHEAERAPCKRKSRRPNSIRAGADATRQSGFCGARAARNRARGHAPARRTDGTATQNS